MKKLFLVFAKLLGMYQLYSALLGTLQLIAMVAMSMHGVPNFAVFLLGLAGMLLYLVVSLAIAWVLIVQTEWLATKVGIRDDEPVPELAKVPALHVGICLIGVFVSIQAVPHISRVLMTFRNVWAHASPDLLWSQLLPSVLQLALGLFLALKPGSVARLLAPRTAST